ncbi:MAG TPA: tRNA (adenosine(37)-N6)-threonylcarbamoyltransferase complex ATPase subunit type 1 TsaE [Candidatus Gastranaerophilales bacterium]|nr:tRNA (adenosine(37)-N6)-threonylcarbamoyltransferase complex ATPase subunit type 1 TsaE [Candidatus Gastranaerophilales bacterium]
MSTPFKFIAENLSDTKKFAEILSKFISSLGILICLYGDIGSGKTTFVKYLAEFLGIKQKVTSPSFVILNEYHSPKTSLYHFDLYRLEKEGVDTIIDELSEYTEKENSVTIIEWAEFSSDNLPKNRLEIQIKYLDETKREFLIRGFGDKNISILQKIADLYCFLRK